LAARSALDGMSAQLDAAGVDLGEMEEVSEEVLTADMIEEAKLDKSQIEPADATEAEAESADLKEVKVKPIKKVVNEEKKSTK
jgi:small subunit ribosomal protein S2